MISAGIRQNQKLREQVRSYSPSGGITTAVAPHVLAESKFRLHRKFWRNQIPGAPQTPVGAHEQREAAMGRAAALNSEIRRINPRTDSGANALAHPLRIHLLPLGCFS